MGKYYIRLIMQEELKLNKKNERGINMIKIAICDDQQIVTEHMSHILLNHKFDADICVDCFTSGLDLYESALKLDIILL